MRAAPRSSVIRFGPFRSAQLFGLEVVVVETNVRSAADEAHVYAKQKRRVSSSAGEMRG